MAGKRVEDSSARARAIAREAAERAREAQSEKEKQKIQAQAAADISNIAGGSKEKRIEITKMLVDEAKKAGLTGSALALPIITTLVEGPNYNNPHGGDQDSLGMFQQRDAWGSDAKRMDPVASVNMFLHGGDGGQPGALSFQGDYDGDPAKLGAWAQATQVSAHPERYQQRLGQAVALMDEAGIEVPDELREEASKYPSDISQVGDGSGGVSGSTGGGGGGSGGVSGSGGGDYDNSAIRKASYNPETVKSLFSNMQGSDIMSLAELLGGLQAIESMSPPQLKDAVKQAVNEGRISPEEGKALTKAIESGDSFKVAAAAGPVVLAHSDAVSSAPGSPPARSDATTVSAPRAQSSAKIPMTV